MSGISTGTALVLLKAFEYRRTNTPHQSQEKRPVSSKDSSATGDAGPGVGDFSFMRGELIVKMDTKNNEIGSVNWISWRSQCVFGVFVCQRSMSHGDLPTVLG